MGKDSAGRRIERESPPVSREQPREARFDISIFPAWCKDCGICAEFCPKGVFDHSSFGSPLVSRPEACNGCQECVLHCPDFAIQVRRRQGKGK